METLLTGAFIFLLGYLVGAFPSAYLLTRLARGTDIRTVGSRNPGAVNVYKEVAPWAGVAVLALDTAKGAAIVLAIGAADLGDFAMFLGAMAALIGHNWPAFLGFRGGKGVAVIFGLSIAVLPGWTLVSASLSLLFGFATRNVIFGISVGFVAINVLTIATSQGATLISLCLTLSAVVVATHFALARKEVLESVRSKGVWGLFDVG